MTFTNLKEAYETVRNVAMGNKFKTYSDMRWVYLSYDKTDDEAEIIIHKECGNMHPVFSNPDIVTAGAFGDRVMKMAEIQKELEEALTE